MGGLLLAAGAMGAGLWYSIQNAYYNEITDVTEIMAYGDAFPVKNYRGIDADTSPLKMRACFDVDWDYFPTDEYKDIATPLIAPNFFKCFDAKEIGADLQAGNATAILAQENEPFGFDRFIAQYEDGRAFMWRQTNSCGTAHFSGDPLPDGCPVPEGAEDKNVMRDRNADIFTLRLTSVIGGTLDDMLIGSDPVTSYSTNGKEFFACFDTPMSFGLLSETYVIADHASPRKTRSPMDCFDHGQIAQDIASGEAMALLGQHDIIPGYDRIIAVYPNGRAVAWHQKVEN
ncbi:hypothetical protein GCM10007939_08590 [Amylibacter marinus]|uniref:Uncharacterized protein n=1 Tax=Amylibacter marinus TaxID=1475483 RepID=A0ABQ5VT74_9RHOB|nr:DUF6446 family protein [Amylibacter marinus]GLQ34576.1 hypothetical protein GCM10007939_08590 [Amylibacter marinus]